MTHRELTEKRNKLLIDARTAMQADNVTAETRASVDAMLADANVLKGDIERMEASAESEQRSLPTNTPPRGAVENHSAKDERSFEERNAAANIALRSFLKGERFEQRDLTVAANGGVMIPVAAVDPIQAKKSAGSIMDIVKRMRTTTGEDVRQPLWDDTANGFVLDSTAVSTTDPSITGTLLKVDGLRSNPILLDNKLVQDVSYDLVTDVNAAINLRYIRSVSQAIVQGNGSNFTALSAPSALTSGTAATVKYADLVGLMTALDPAYTTNAVWSFSTSTLGAVMNLADANGRPLFLPFNDGGISGFVGTIFGFPVKIDQYASTVATGNTPIRFGDHSAAYTLREVEPGIVIKQSADRWIELNRLGVVAFARAGGAPTIASTTTPSLVSLTIK
ncbi:MAG: phage major capsid protein [Acidobacteriaceae bacterium]|nr:phage major capsid protein [Acidobacteriaceae bacterium]